jgi:hypothetical protein
VAAIVIVVNAASAAVTAASAAIAIGIEVAIAHRARNRSKRTPRQQHPPQHPQWHPQSVDRSVARASDAVVMGVTEAVTAVARIRVVASGKSRASATRPAIVAHPLGAQRATQQAPRRVPRWRALQSRHRLPRRALQPPKL